MKKIIFDDTIKIMLDQNDLTAIGNLIKAGNESVKQELRQEIAPLKTDIVAIKTDMFEVKTKIVRMEKDIRKIKKNQETITNFFDREYLSVDKRVKTIEKHLGLPTPEFKLISSNR